MTSSSSIDGRVELRRHTPRSPWTYAMLDVRQREIAERVRTGGDGALLVSELAPVITVGRRTSPADYLMAGETPVYPTDRGGLATYHGLGQWVLFPVDRLERLTGDSRGVRKAVCALLEVAREVGSRYFPEAGIREGAEMGVWCKHGKFAAVGVHIEKGVLLHGLSVNGFKTPQSFAGLRPCGLDLPVAYLLGEEGESGFTRLGAELSEAMLKDIF